MASQAELLGAADPRELGRRIRNARVSAGLSQAQLAGADVSVGYVSRIEKGQRRPTPALLDAFAERLAVTTTALLTGATTETLDELRLELDLAELALAGGDSRETLERTARVIAQTQSRDLTDLRRRAQYLHALAAEHQGCLDEAIARLEDLAAGFEEPCLLALDATLALSRCYRESGDLTQAVQCAAGLVTRIEGTPLDHTDEAIKLAATMAGAHIEAGEFGRAVRVCKRALVKAEATGSPTALGAVYWNMSAAEESRGNLREALALAERALTHFRSSGTPRMRAMLRQQLAYLELRVDPPDPRAALRNLDQSEDEIAPLDPATRARRQTTAARAQLINGDAVLAAEMAAAVCDQCGFDLPLVAAEAGAVQGQALVALGDFESGVGCLRQAVALLTGIGNDREVAQLWYELAVRLDELGETELALTAYRGATAASGFTAPPSTVSDQARSSRA